MKSVLLNKRNVNTIITVVVAHEEAMQMQVLHIIQECVEISRRLRKLRMAIQRNNMVIAAIYGEHLHIRRQRRLWTVVNRYIRQ